MSFGSPFRDYACVFNAIRGYFSRRVASKLGDTVLFSRGSGHHGVECCVPPRARMGPKRAWRCNCGECYELWLKSR